LIAWRAAHSNPVGRELEQYILLSLTADDLPAALEAAMKAGFRSVPRPATMKLVERLIDERQMPLLYAIQQDLNESLLQDAPLLAAKLAFLEGRTEQAKSHLSRVDLLALKPDQHADWLQLIEKLHTERQVYSRLSSLWLSLQLPQSFLSIYADLSRKLGRQDRLIEIATKLGIQFPAKELN